MCAGSSTNIFQPPLPWDSDVPTARPQPWPNLGEPVIPTPSHLAFGLAEGLVIVTFDQRFTGHIRDLRDHAGLIIARKGRFDVGWLVRGLSDLSAVESLESMRNQIRYL